MRRVVEIALFTDDPDRLTAFYGQLLEAEPAERWEGGATFDLDGLKLLIHVSDPGSRDHVAIGAQDVDAAAETLRALGVEIDGPNDYDWGRSAYLQDPDGRLVELHRPT
jgi:catechol 2,3-dioxygenase-like lactoylglutathione lyase family enzyme